MEEEKTTGGMTALSRMREGEGSGERLPGWRKSCRRASTSWAVGFVVEMEARTGRGRNLFPRSPEPISAGVYVGMEPELIDGGTTDPLKGGKSRGDAPGRIRRGEMSVIVMGAENDRYAEFALEHFGHLLRRGIGATGFGIGQARTEINDVRLNV